MIFKRRAKLNDSRNEQQRLLEQIWQRIEQMKEPLSTLALIDAVLMRELAAFRDDERCAWLYEALALYDQALRTWSLDPPWPRVAQLHRNRANLLRDIARLPGEDRRARLHEALAAYQQALRFYDLGDQPVARAEAQVSKAGVLIDLATIAGEDRRAHAVAALAACDEALRVHLREQRPRSYALAQSRRGATLLELSRMPGEDRLARLGGALQAYQEALRFYTVEQTPREHAQTLLGQTPVFVDIAVLYSYEETLRLNASEPDPLHIQKLLGQGRSFADLAALIGGDRRTWLVRALRSAWMALPIFREVQDQPGVESALALLRGLRLFCGDDFAAFWREIEAEPAPDWGDGYTIDQLLSAVNMQADLGAIMAFWSRVPPEQREPLLAAMKERIAQAQDEADDPVAVSLGQKLEAIQRLGDCPPQLIRQSRLAVDRYCALREIAGRNEHDIGGWQQAIAAGEALLALASEQNPALDRRAICKELADDYICMASAYRGSNDLEAIQEALKRAAGLRPDGALETV